MISTEMGWLIILRNDRMMALVEQIIGLYAILIWYIYYTSSWNPYHSVWFGLEQKTRKKKEYKAEVDR